MQSGILSGSSGMRQMLPQLSCSRSNGFALLHIVARTSSRSSSSSSSASWLCQGSWHMQAKACLVSVKSLPGKSDGDGKHINLIQAATSSKSRMYSPYLLALRVIAMCSKKHSTIAYSKAAAQGFSKGTCNRHGEIMWACRFLCKRCPRSMCQ